MWDGNTSNTSTLLTADEDICAINWMQKGSCLAIGHQNGNVELWDTIKGMLIRKINSFTDSNNVRVCALAWNNNILSCGSQDAKIYNHDVRIKESKVSTLIGHASEVCSLSWSPDGRLLASGGDDNKLCIWDINNSSYSRTNNNFNLQKQLHINCNNNNQNFNTFSLNITNNFNVSNNSNNNMINSSNNIDNSTNLNNRWNTFNLNQNINNINNLNNFTSNTETFTANTNNNQLNNFPINEYINNQNVIYPKFSFNNHISAVKALAWCPWQKNILVSGGGKKDKTIKFWNVDTGSLINSLDTGSQICTLHFSKNEKEIISTHGYSRNQVSLWKYHNMSKLCELQGHTSRVLYSSLSPDGNTLVTGSGDETLRFWKINDKLKTNEKMDLDYNYKTSNTKINNSFHIR